MGELSLLLLSSRLRLEAVGVLLSSSPFLGVF